MISVFETRESAVLFSVSPLFAREKSLPSTSSAVVGVCVRVEGERGREGERGKEREKGRERGKEREREGERERGKERERWRERGKEGGRESSKEREKEGRRDREGGGGGEEGGKESKRSDWYDITYIIVSYTHVWTYICTSSHL